MGFPSRAREAPARQSHRYRCAGAGPWWSPLLFAGLQLAQTVLDSLVEVVLHAGQGRVERGEAVRAHPIVCHALDCSYLRVARGTAEQRHLSEMIAGPQGLDQLFGPVRPPHQHVDSSRLEHVDVPAGVTLTE